MHRTTRGVLFVLWGTACSADPKSEQDSAAPATEPLNLPDDPADNGVPVGTSTLQVGGATVHVWYPASDSAAGDAGEPVRLADQVPTSVRDALGDVVLPSIDTIAMRDAPWRNTGTPPAVVLFSHGFGGFAAQSVDLTTHLASRGYVVFSMDHAGRSIGDLLPCMFSPPLEGCALSGEDPGPADLAAVLTALEAGIPELPTLDTETVAVVGHSAGAGTASSLADADPRIDAAVLMAGPPGLTRQLPLLLLDGSCDGIVPETSVAPAFSALGFGTRVRFEGAGHLAFSDLCDLEFGRLAEEILAPRDDVNSALLGQLVALGTDGCPGGVVTIPECGDEFMPLEVSTPVVRAAVTTFLDSALLNTGGGVAADYGAGIEITGD